MQELSAERLAEVRASCAPSRIAAFIAKQTDLPITADSIVCSCIVRTISLVPLGIMGDAVVYKEGAEYRVALTPWSTAHSKAA